MALNQWLRSSLVVLAAALAITSLLDGRSFSQDADEEEDIPPEAAHTLTIRITADEHGKTSSIRVGLAKLFDGPLDDRKLAVLNRRLKDVFAIEGKPFDRVLFRVDDALKSGDLIKVIQVCEKQKMADGKPITKMSFVVGAED